MGFGQRALESMVVLNILYQFNEKYVPYAGVSITSLLENNRDADEINIYALTEGISASSRDTLTKLIEGYGRKIHFPDTADLIKRFKSMGMIPYRGAYSVYLRLFFTELLPVDAHRVIYLDSDTIVDGSLLPLAEYDLGGKTLGMVLESITDDYKIMIGMKKEDEYYNSGVILFDADAWRRENYCDRLVDHIRNVRSSYIGDQDFLNIVCCGDVCRLPIEYNFQPLHGRYTPAQYFSCFGQNPYYSRTEVEASNHPVIFHCYRWLGEFPWNKGNLHPFNDVYDKYIRISSFSGVQKVRAHSGIVLGIEKILYRMLPRVIFIRIFRMAHERMLRQAEADARAMKENRNS